MSVTAAQGKPSLPVENNIRMLLFIYGNFITFSLQYYHILFYSVLAVIAERRAQ